MVNHIKETYQPTSTMRWKNGALFMVQLAHGGFNHQQGFSGDIMGKVMVCASKRLVGWLRTGFITIYGI